MSLPSLSNELLSEVIGHLVIRITDDGQWNGIRNTKPAAAFTLTCKRINELAIPILYSAINDEHCSKGAAPWRWTFIRRPELAKCVKRFPPGCQVASGHLNVMDAFSEAALSDADVARYKPWIDQSRAHIPPARLYGFEGLLREGDDVALTALLFTIFPNLESIEFREFIDVDEPSDTFIHGVFDVAGASHAPGFNGPKLLPKVRDISFRFLCENTGGSTLGPLMSFCLPSVTRAYIEGIEVCDAYDRGPRSHPHIETGLLELTIDGEIDRNFLPPFLTTFPVLKKLHYREVGDLYTDHHFSPLKVRQSLLHLEHCLEDLSFDVSLRGDMPTGHSNGTFEPFGSLSNLSALTVSR
ncbi:hypothetical protein DL98DRAFT_593922 [Cadophora sp. DSE1049]|nr:hypothetical protein DL98DRAFT_593922 [Cadophora sp. DSE1049]